jgi:hypothetical protein
VAKPDAAEANGPDTSLRLCVGFSVYSLTLGFGDNC